MRQALPFIQRIAQHYNKRVGLAPIVEGHYVPVDAVLATEIANYYEQATSEPYSAIVTQAYKQLGDEVLQQFIELLVHGITFEAWRQEGQPYATSQEMQADVRDNQHIWFFIGGEPHPLWNYPIVDDWTLNDIFRAVHDVFGHAAEGFQFGQRGEENAWVHHSMMFSPLAQLALTTETRGQNSWVNSGPYAQLSVTERPFAEQKVFLLPAAYTNWKEALAR